MEAAPNKRSYLRLAAGRAPRLLEDVLVAKQAGLGCFERLKHLWLDAGYQGKEWLA